MTDYAKTQSCKLSTQKMWWADGHPREAKTVKTSALQVSLILNIWAKFFLYKYKVHPTGLKAVKLKFVSNHIPNNSLTKSRLVVLYKWKVCWLTSLWDAREGGWVSCDMYC